VLIEVTILKDNSLPTVDEIVSSLKRSFIPIILIEGTDDIFVYRHLKSRLNTTLVTLQSCGGRTNLFSIHDRRAEFSDKNIIFVADKDAYRFEGIPNERKNIIFTSGYCIENDIYHGSNIENFIDEEDKIEHELLRKIIGKWFAFEVDKYKTAISNSSLTNLSVAAHINVVSPHGFSDMCPDFSRKIGYSEPDAIFIEYIFQEYNLNIRGKQLFQMLSRFLSKKGRFSNFSDKNLVEIALKQDNNHLIDVLVLNIKNQIECKFNTEHEVNDTSCN
jgi:hypothetical protein